MLMLVRSLLLGALAFAMARPYFSREAEGVAGASESGGTTVLVLDASWPMAAEVDGEPLFDRARLLGGRVLDALGSTGQAALAVAGDKVIVPIAEPTADLGAVRAALDQTKRSRQAHGSLADAVTRAYEVLSPPPPPWGVAAWSCSRPRPGPRAPLPQPPPNSDIQLLPVDAAEAAQRWTTAAIVDVALRPAPEVGQGMWRVDARVANFGATEPWSACPCTWRSTARSAVRGFVTLAPGESAVKSFNADVGEARGRRAQAAVVLENGRPGDGRPRGLLAAPRAAPAPAGGERGPPPDAAARRALLPGARGGPGHARSAPGSK
jgi:hypothetical protein